MYLADLMYTLIDAGGVALVVYGNRFLLIGHHDEGMPGARRALGRDLPAPAQAGTQGVGHPGLPGSVVGSAAQLADDHELAGGRLVGGT
jgi:hypothetical protein